MTQEKSKEEEKGGESTHDGSVNMTQKYSVYVDDNFHAYDESERYLKGEYESLEEAIAASKKIVDDFLERGYTEGMSAKQLMDQYRGFGEDPFIMPGDGGVPFSAWKYAEARCEEICGLGEGRI